MQISRVQPNTPMIQQASESIDGLASRLAESFVFTSFGDAANGSLRDILARYDVQRISPRSFAEMLQRLRGAGQIEESEFRELSLLRLEMDRAGLDPDQEIDLIALVEKSLREQQDELKRAERKSGVLLSAADRKAALASLERQLEWLHKFAAIHQNRATGALDALA